jgi:hypothetical protein
MGYVFSLSKSTTLTSLAISEVALLLFGLLLVVGLIGEYAKSEKWRKYIKVFEIFVILGVAGELIADGGIFLFSSHLQTIADQSEADLVVEQRKTAEAQKEAAQAQLELKHAVEDVSRNQRPRFFDQDAFVRVARGKPFAFARVLYDPGNWEAYRFAFEIVSAIRKADGWGVDGPLAIPKHFGEASLSKARNAPAGARFSDTGIGCGITVLVKNGAALENPNKNNATWALVHGLTLGCLAYGPFVTSDESWLPSGEFVVVVHAR